MNNNVNKKNADLWNSKFFYKIGSSSLWKGKDSHLQYIKNIS